MCARILLRQWQDSDLEPCVEMNADPQVMRYFVAPLSREETIASVERLSGEIDRRGWGLWAVEVDGAFAGFTGLSEPTFEAPFVPCVEIGWRFRREHWGKGVAFAAARDAESFAFRNLQLPELLTFTAAINLPSRRLMERLGFVRDLEGDFLHPRVPQGHPLRPHVLYRKRWC
jgi:RimJ/RimL family protein N-acetyltransferase